MVFPMPSMNFGGEAPPAVLKLRQYFIGILSFQVVLMAFRFAGLGMPNPDIWGGFYQLILICLGAYAVKDGVNVMFTTYYGFMSLITGILDLVSFIDLSVKGWPYFVGGDIAHNIGMVGYSLSCPICLCGAYLSWTAYQKTQESASGVYRQGGEDQETGGGGFFGSGGDYGSNANSRQSQFTAFAGSGNKLGAN